MKKLENYGVQELDACEVANIDGGGIFWWLELWGGLNFINNNPEFWVPHEEYV